METTTWTAIGTTDDVTECMFCGRTDLRMTIVLRDEDGETTYAGSECGRQIAGRPVKAAAVAADHKARMAAAHASQAASQADRAAARTGMTREEVLAGIDAGTYSLAPFIVRALRRNDESTWAMFFGGELAA